MQDTATSKAIISASTFYALLGISFIVSFIGLFIPVMEVDASQYASMSQELFQSFSILQFTDLGKDYLDKPPLLFWLSGLSISLLGNTSFAFKLPSFMLAWFSVYALYRFVKIYYSESVTQLSTLVYTCSVAFLLFTNDIRTDTLMIAFVVISIWQLGEYINNEKSKHLFIATIMMSLAMLAKGPIGFVVPLLALGPHLLLSKNLKKFIRWEIITLPILILLVLSPMLIGLYQQWGVHGIRFFFWEQSFGRITGENVWENDTSYFYFLHNIIWVVLPFTLFFILALYRNVKKWKNQNEYISFFGLVLPFLALSLSHYKLPHYIYVVVPFSSILIAKAINEWLNDKNKYLDLFLYYVQFILIAAILIVPIVLLMAFPATALMYGIYILGVIGVFFIFYFLQFQKQALIIASFSAFLLTAFFINSHGYPSLLKYQGSTEAAFFIEKNKIPTGQVFQRNIWWRGFHYYSGRLVPSYSEALPHEQGLYVLTDEVGYQEFKLSHKVGIVQTFPHFNVTRLSMDFLNPASRKSKLKTLYLLQIFPKS